MARPLKHWLYKHRANPYPTKDEKAQLARSAHMTLTQVSNWFANARRRLKNTVQDPGLSWGRRIKLYNSCVEGNAERLSVCSDDDLWDTDMESSTRGPYRISYSRCYLKPTWLAYCYGMLYWHVMAVARPIYRYNVAIVIILQFCIFSSTLLCYSFVHNSIVYILPLQPNM